MQLISAGCLMLKGLVSVSDQKKQTCEDKYLEENRFLNGSYKLRVRTESTSPQSSTKMLVWTVGPQFETRVLFVQHSVVSLEPLKMKKCNKVFTLICFFKSDCKI